MGAGDQREDNLDLLDNWDNFLIGNFLNKITFIISLLSEKTEVFRNLSLTMGSTTPLYISNR